MPSLNRCEFIGNLGADPEVRRMQSGDAVVSLRLAVSESWRDRTSGKYKERTEWVSVVIFNENIAKVAEQYLRKGSKIYIAGQLQTRKWQDQSGADRFSTEIVLQKFRGELVLLDRKSGEDQDEAAPKHARGTSSAEPSDTYGDDLSDDIPF